MSIQVLETQAEELGRADAVLRWSSSNKWWFCLFCVFVCLFVSFFLSFFLSFFFSFVWVCLSEFNLSLLKGIMFSLCCFWSFCVFQCPYILQMFAETPRLGGSTRCDWADGLWLVLTGVEEPWVDETFAKETVLDFFVEALIFFQVHIYPIFEVAWSLMKP